MSAPTKHWDDMTEEERSAFAREIIPVPQPPLTEREIAHGRIVAERIAADYAERLHAWLDSAPTPALREAAIMALEIHERDSRERKA